MSDLNLKPLPLSDLIIAYHLHNGPLIQAIPQPSSNPQDVPASRLEALILDTLEPAKIHVIRIEGNGLLVFQEHKSTRLVHDRGACPRPHPIFVEAHDGKPSRQKPKVFADVGDVGGVPGQGVYELGVASPPAEPSPQDRGKGFGHGQPPGLIGSKVRRAVQQLSVMSVSHTPSREMGCVYKTMGCREEVLVTFVVSRHVKRLDRGQRAGCKHHMGSNLTCFNTIPPRLWATNTIGLP